jgi:uncharacterized protein (DUF1697 family)
MKIKPEKYIALLRGINVGGKNLIQMRELKEIFESLGFENVRTYIQSGNVLFESDNEIESEAIRVLEPALKNRLGNEINVFIRSAAEIRTIVKLNPFGRIKTDAKYYVTFIQKPLKIKPELPMFSPNKDVEIIGINKREIYSRSIMVNGRSGFPNNYSEKEFGIKATTRNWTTVCKLSDLAAQ